MQARSMGWLVALSAADAAAVLALRPDAAAVARTLRHLSAVIAREGADAALAPLAGAAVWLAAWWLGGGLLAAAGTRLPGIAGRLASRLAKALLPRAIRADVHHPDERERERP